MIAQHKKYQLHDAFYHPCSLSRLWLSSIHPEYLFLRLKNYVVIVKQRCIYILFVHLIVFLAAYHFPLYRKILYNISHSMEEGPVLILICFLVVGVLVNPYFDMALGQQLSFRKCVAQHFLTPKPLNNVPFALLILINLSWHVQVLRAL